MKELVTVLTDEPGLLGPKARERNVGRVMMIKDSMWGLTLAFMSFCISESSDVCLYMYMLIPLSLLGVQQMCCIFFGALM